MLIIIYVLLTVGVGRCKDGLIIETKAVSVGAEVTLTCPRLKSEIDANLFWIRFIPGKWPELLGGTYSFDFASKDKETRINHIKAIQKPETFVLHISKFKLSDAGLYYCIKTDLLNMTFMTGWFLRIKGKEPNITAIIQHPVPDGVHPGDPVSLQCSVLFNSEDETCPTDHRVYWFQTGSSKSPSFIYARRNHGNECDNNAEDHSGQRCIYNFLVNVSASDVGTYYCAVASCGVIMYSKGIKPDTEEPIEWEFQKTNIVFILLCAVLTVSVVVIFILVYIIRKKTCHCSKDAVCDPDDQQLHQRDGIPLIYTAPTFTREKAPRTESRNIETPEAIYSGVRG